jgi:hypothetical protein
VLCWFSVFVGCVCFGEVRLGWLGVVPSLFGAVGGGLWWVEVCCVASGAI